jgi:pimeloyl-ACP methyl ester carboxylesterase
MPTTERFLQANGLRHHVLEAGSGPLVLLLHGFPEGSHSWRHQLGALADAGYHAVAPDVRGYGQTDAPPDIASYRMRELVADAAGLVEALGERTAVVVGHDWGAVIAWHCALLRPDRFHAVAALSVPLAPRPPAAPTVVLKQRTAGSFFYMLYFQEPGVAEAELEADIRRSLRLIYFNASGEGSPVGGFLGKPAGAKLLDGMVDPPVLPAWLTEQDLDAYVADFQRSGFRGPLNRYRNMDRDWEELADVGDAKVTIPALFVAGEKDLVLVPDAVERMKARVPDLRGVVLLPGAGHWIQQERPVETNAALLGFLGQVNAGR